METTFTATYDQARLDLVEGDLKVSFFGPGSAYEQYKLTQRARKTRVHIWGEEPTDYSDMPAGWMYDPSPEVKKLTRQHNKLELQRMNDLRLDAQELLASVNLEEIATQKLRFSRYAGCACGCSPGFIADRLIVVTVPGTEQRFPVDTIHIERKRAK